MSTGGYISGIGHAGLLLWLVMGWGFDAEPLDFEIAPVSVVSGEEYAALVAATSPQPQTEQPPAPETPVVEETPPAPETPQETPAEPAPPPPAPAAPAEETPPPPTPEPLPEPPAEAVEEIATPPAPLPLRRRRCRSCRTSPSAPCPAPRPAWRRRPLRRRRLTRRWPMPCARPRRPMLKAPRWPRSRRRQPPRGGHDRDRDRG